MVRDYSALFLLVKKFRFFLTYNVHLYFIFSRYLKHLKMKTNLLLSALGLLFLAFLFYDASSGVAAVQGVDRTGSPVSVSGCDACHSGGNFETSISLEILDGGTPVNSYEPGKTYTYQVTIDASNEPSGYGFQTVALAAADDTNAGSFGTAPNGTQITSLAGRDYFEHSRRNSSNSWSIEWTAPAAGTGEVNLYAAANAVDGNGSTGGDDPARLATPLVLDENTTSSFSSPEELELRMNVFPNPIRDHLYLEITGSKVDRLMLRLLDASGQIVRSELLTLVNGQSSREITVQALPAGLYFLNLSDGQKVKTRIVMKK